MIAATTAIDARCRSGHQGAAIPQMACAMMATATSFNPCSSPAPTTLLSASTPRATSTRRYRGGQSKRGPRRQRAEKARAHQPNGKPNLAARRPRQKLAERHEIRVSALVQPAPAHDKCLTKVTEVRNRPAKRGQTEPQEDEEHLPRRAPSSVGGLLLPVRSRLRSSDQQVI